jgi:uncharacterized lipoprotein YbaY
MSRIVFFLGTLTVAAAGTLELPQLSLRVAQSFLSQAPAAPVSQPAQQTPTPAPPPHPVSRSPLHFVLPRRAYLCAGGVRVVILVETNAAQLTLNDHIYNMKQVESSAGTKYAEGSVVWFSDGDSGFLQDETVPGKPQMLATNCHLQSVYPPFAPADGSLTGTVSYRQRMALPPDAVLLVHLQDIYLPDAPSPFIAEFKTTLGGRQMPVPFTLKYDPAKIDPNHPYVVEASILVHDQLRFTNDTAYFVLTQGHPAKVAMILVGIDARAAGKP